MCFQLLFLLVSLFISIQFFSREWQVITSSFEMFFYKPTTSLLFSLLVFQQFHSTLLLKMPFQALLWQKLAFSSPFSYLNYLSSILLLRRHCDVALFYPSSCFVMIVFFLCSSIQPGCRVFFRALSSYQILHPFSTGVLSKLYHSYSFSISF